ncbi:transposase [Vreelandella subglaciescola]|jgi:hypothetical protein|uniref:Uncharacterized protein n=1 Tax=Vreelandella subglaciescola TaxID=29571 RepID=A0A1M7GV53_9GAMM|nr:transposase [Halomonas subglaciescola]SHM19988.1 hypothetical protein SAMN05878437_1739 [Halomonas subglaciescola]
MTRKRRSFSTEFKQEAASLVLDPTLHQQVDDTIAQLKLDDTGNRHKRATDFQGFVEGDYTAEFLRKRSPFVYREAMRQGLLT